MTKEILRCPYSAYPLGAQMDPNCDCIDCKARRRDYGFSPVDATPEQNFNVGGCMDDKKICSDD